MAILKSFSRPHDYAYSIEAVQEANLATKYNPMFWACACLSVNAGSADSDITDEDMNEESEESASENDEETEEGKKKVNTTNYDKVTRALYTAINQGVVVAPPDINSAEMDFSPNLEKNQINYGFQAFTNFNEDLYNRIIALRPFVSISDFFSRVQPTNVQMISLIKGGAFDLIESNRQKAMNDYLKLYAKTKVDYKNKLTATDYKKMLEYGIVPVEFSLANRVQIYKNYCDSYCLNKETKKYTLEEEQEIVFFKDYYEKHLTLGKDYDIINSTYQIKQNAFKKVTDFHLAPIKEYLLTDTAKEKYYEARLNEIIEATREKYCQGTISDWEFDALHYYYHEHPLSHIMTNLYKIKPFESLNEQPATLGTKIGRDGQERPVYDITSIVGTVTNANNNKHIVTLLTQYGEIVDVKFYAGQYIYLNKNISEIDEKGKKTMLERSWFTRGTKLMISGVRRENSFLPKTNYEQGFKQSVRLIKGISATGVPNFVEERIQ